MKSALKHFGSIMLLLLIVVGPATLVAFTKTFVRIANPKAFETWKTVTIGGCPSVDCYLCDSTIVWGDQGIDHDRTAEMLHDSNLLNANKTELEIVKVTPADMGFNQNPTYKEFCNRAEKCGLVMCPAEVGPALRQQYREQPINKEISNMLFVAMEPLHCSVFILGNTSKAGLAIGWSACIPNVKCDLNQTFVFCKKK